MKKIILCAFIYLVSYHCMAQQTHRFEVANGEFLLDGKPIKIYSGEIHFSRIPQPYWKHRLQMIKAMGLNTIATYVFWNYHNPSPGVWDWKTDNHNLREFLQTAQEVGLYVILRPGPYACGEWDFGGYPWWFSLDKNMAIRTNNKPFLDSCKTYLTQLGQQIKGMHITEGGPIIMTQVENEFGSFVSQRKDISIAEHVAYKNQVETLLKQTGFKPPFMTSDGIRQFEGGSIGDALPAANGETDPVKIKKAVDAYHGGVGPYMVAEYYPGWLDHWAEPFVRLPSEQVVNQLKKYIDGNVNFNIYMVHGGTNFGFTSGANYNGSHDIQPDITSYDYDAPINESGWPTDKYMAIRELMKKNVEYPVPEIPEKLPVISIPNIKFRESSDFFDWKKQIKPVYADIPSTFEALGQANGYVLYSRRFNEPVSGKLKLPGLRDYATVYLDGKKVGELNRYYNKFEMDIDVPFNSTLDILVESMGRINFGAQIANNLKGIISPVLIDNTEVTGNWEMYPVPLTNLPQIKPKESNAKAGLPAFYAANFTLRNAGDTFLDMSNWGKGVVFVNGHNLGRFWNVGPQQTLYLPGCWLKKGNNEIVVFDQLNDHLQSGISAKDVPVLYELKKP